MDKTGFDLILRDVSKKINGVSILHHISMSVRKGECLVLLGPSGCGKTTLLRLIAGLENPDSGDILFRDRSILSVPPNRRNFSMMFQDFALFPHRNVFDNISFGLEMKKKSSGDIQKRVSQMLELVNLEGFGSRPVSSLSGGESQRVALARALAPDPDCILLDEPLGSLDRTLKERLLEDLIFILKKVRTTAIFVTHDQKEAFSAADRICVMNTGRIEQTASPARLYHHPESRTVAEFLGFKNMIPCRVTPEGDIHTSIGIFRAETVNLKTVGPNSRNHLLILPNYARFISENRFRSLAKNRLTGRLVRVVFTGEICSVTVKTGHDSPLIFYAPPDFQFPETNTPVFFEIDSKGCCVF